MKPFKSNYATASQELFNDGTSQKATTSSKRK
jgi:hypothetical protein